MHAYVVCFEGQVRLNGGITAADSNIELCLWNQWKYICSDDGSANDMMVVCHQLELEQSKYM